MLADGTYDVLVVDAHEAGGEAASEGAAAGALSLDLTILAGEHKGEVVTVRASGVHADPLDLLAVPGTLVVEGGEPRVALEP